MENVWEKSPPITSILPAVPPPLQLNNHLDEESTSDNPFYKELAAPQEEDELFDNLRLQSALARLTLTIIRPDELNHDDEIYKLATLAEQASDKEIFDYHTFSPNTYIKFKYGDIPKFLDLIFSKVNASTLSNNKNPILPALIVFQMLRYSFYKKQNMGLANSFLELFVNRVYLIIEDDINGTLLASTPQPIQGEFEDDDSSKSFGQSSVIPTPKVSKKQLMQTKIRKKNDIVLIAYWISVVNHLFYYLLRQDDFFPRNPGVLKKLVSVLNDLVNEFVTGITNRLADLVDDCILNYSSISLQKGLLFQKDWNFFKSDHGPSNTFQEILDNLYPPDLKLQLKPSPTKFVQVLEAIVYVFKLYNISSIILKNLFSRVFAWLDHTVFNKIMANKNKGGRNYLTRTFAIQLRLNMSTVEDWIRSVSKQLEEEAQEMNPGGLNNEEYYLGELGMVVRDYPDDIVDFKAELPVLRFRDNKRFVVKEKKKEKEKEKVKEVKEEQKQQQKEENKDQKLEKEEDTKKDTRDEKKGEVEDRKDRDGDQQLMPDTPQKPEDPEQDDHFELKTVSPEPFIDLEDEEEVIAQTNIEDVPPPYISDFYYASLYQIFKQHLQILYNLLEFLQVGSTCIEALTRQVTRQSEKTNKTLKQVNKEICEASEDFLKQDIKWLNWKQIHYIIKNYKYEVEETKIPKAVVKHIGSLAKELSQNPSILKDSDLRFVDYLAPSHSTSRIKSGIGAILSDEYMIYLNPMSGRSYPMCLPTKQELINRFGAGMSGLNRENMERNQPFLDDVTRDMVEEIRDQLELSDDGDSDEEMTRPSQVISPVGEDDMDTLTGQFHDLMFGEASGRGAGILDDMGMTRPENLAVKEWDRGEKGEKDLGYNPW